MKLMELSFFGAVFIIAVVMTRAAAVNYLPKKTFLALWEMVLLRLLIPFRVPSVCSVYTFIHFIKRRVPVPIFIPASNELTPQSAIVGLRSRHLANATGYFTEAEKGGIISAISQGNSAMMRNAERVPANSLSVSLWFVVWCAGALFLAMFLAIVYFCCRMEFQTALPVDNAYAEQWLKEHPLKRQITIRQSERISTPLTYGVFHPVILMPKRTEWENVNYLQYIFAHEYVHICRFDTVRKLAAALVLCIHWFNPFVWIMYILFNRDIELACDESVIKQFGEKSKSDYSFMLISMAAERGGLLPFCSGFSKNAVEERIIAIMNTKRTTLITFLSACLIVFAVVGLFATSATAPAGDGFRDEAMIRDFHTDAKAAVTKKASTMSIVHESADILHYEDGAPYIHDILTNNTDRNIIETQYCMLAYDEDGCPLKLYWNFLDSSAESSFENIVRSKEWLLSNQTEEYRGGWSLYDGETMNNFPKVGDGGKNQAVYSLFCLKQVVFEDGLVWNNPNYEKWLDIYAGKEISVDELQNYYPHEYKIEDLARK